MVASLTNARSKLKPQCVPDWCRGAKQLTSDPRALDRSGADDGDTSLPGAATETGIGFRLYFKLRSSCGGGLAGSMRFVKLAGTDAALPI